MPSFDPATAVATLTQILRLGKALQQLVRDRGKQVTKEELAQVLAANVDAETAWELSKQRQLQKQAPKKTPKKKTTE